MSWLIKIGPVYFDCDVEMLCKHPEKHGKMCNLFGDEVMPVAGGGLVGV